MDTEKQDRLDPAAADVAETRAPSGADHRASLQASEARYRSLFENMVDGYAHCEMLYDQGQPVDFVYLDVNRAFELLTGLQGVVGRRVTEIIPRIRDTNPEVFAIYGRVAATGTPEEFETYLDQLGKWFWISVFRPQEGQFVATFGDITARKESEAKIQQLNETLEERVRARTAELEAANQDLESFAYSISHDLRAPLRAIDGFSRMLVQDYAAALDAEGQQMCERIGHNARRMGQLIDDLLAYSRVGRAEPRSRQIDMKRLVRSVFEELTQHAEQERIDFAVGNLPPGVGDVALMRQVWVNLVANAIKFTERREVAVIEVGGQVSAKENTYWIRDNGAGFDMQYIDKLFGVFQRLHSVTEFEGTGVGLAIVQKAVQRQGGRVWAEAAVGAGATFSFTLPNPRRKGAAAG